MWTLYLKMHEHQQQIGGFASRFNVQKRGIQLLHKLLKTTSCTFPLQNESMQMEETEFTVEKFHSIAL